MAILFGTVLGACNSNSSQQLGNEAYKVFNSAPDHESQAYDRLQSSQDPSGYLIVSRDLMSTVAQLRALETRASTGALLGDIRGLVSALRQQSQAAENLGDSSAPKSANLLKSFQDNQVLIERAANRLRQFLGIPLPA